MSYKERFGCFFLAVGMVTFLLFAIPVVQAFRKDPGTVPGEWIGIALFALLVIWMGWKLYRSARRSANPKNLPVWERGLRLNGNPTGVKTERIPRIAGGDESMRGAVPIRPQSTRAARSALASPCWI